MVCLVMGWIELVEFKDLSMVVVAVATFNLLLLSAAIIALTKVELVLDSFDAENF